MENTNTPDAGNSEQKPFSRPFIIPETLPESENIMLMGILSIVTGCIGIIFSIIALRKVPEAKALYLSNPGKYSSESYGKVKTGEACAWVGLALNIIGFLFAIVYFFFIVAMSTGNRW